MNNKKKLGFFVKLLINLGLLIDPSKANNKLHCTKVKSRQFLSSILFIGIACYVGFTPLYEFFGDEVSTGVIGAAFGTIFVIIITMYLLNKQTEIEQESERNKMLFEKKLGLYKDMIDEYSKLLENHELSSKEWLKTIFNMIDLQMIAGRSTLIQYQSVLKEIDEVYKSADEKNSNIDENTQQKNVKLSEAQIRDIMKGLMAFAKECRKDLSSDEISKEDHDKFIGTIESIFSSEKEMDEEEEQDIIIENKDTNNNGKSLSSAKSIKPGPIWDGRKRMQIDFTREVMRFYAGYEYEKETDENGNTKINVKERDNLLTIEQFLEVFPNALVDPKNFKLNKDKPDDLKMKIDDIILPKNEAIAANQGAPWKYWAEGCKKFDPSYYIKLRSKNGNVEEYAVWRSFGAWNISDYFNNLQDSKNENELAHVIEKIDFDNEIMEKYIEDLDVPKLSSNNLDQKINFLDKLYRIQKKTDRAEFVHDVLNHYINNNKPTYDALMIAFPSRLRTSANKIDYKGKKKIIKDYDQAKQESGWFTDDDKVLTIEGKKYFSSSQWPKKYFKNFYEHCKNNKEIKNLLS